MRRLWLVLLFLPLVAVAADYAVDGGVDRAQFVRFNDFGATTDFEANMPVYFPKPPENYELWGMKDGAYVRYENPKRFYWVTKPSNPGAYTTARVIKSYYAAKVRLAPVAGARPRRPGDPLQGQPARARVGASAHEQRLDADRRVGR